MRVGREEALDLLRKFASEQALLECRMQFPILAGRFRGRLTLNDADLHLRSDDGGVEFVFRVTRAVEFAYGDARTLPTAERFEGVLLLIFRLGEEAGADDFISLTEIIPR